jgi:hypothetical protein
MSYLWFIGVDPEYQGQDIGNNLLDNIIKGSDKRQRPVYLETSTLKIYRGTKNWVFRYTMNWILLISYFFSGEK